MITDSNIAKKLVMLEKSALDRGIEFNVSFKKLKQLMNSKKCFYTGALLTSIENDDNKFTIDRVDASKGYVDNNIVQCSLRFNRMKANLTIDDIKLIARKLKTKGININETPKKK